MKWGKQLPKSVVEYTHSGWGKFNFYQLKKGYRFSVDSVLLAAFVRYKKNSVILEAGVGEGIIPILLKAKEKPFTYTGIEIQPELSQLAKKNLELNGINATIITGDWNNLKLIQSEQFDIGIVNPPYYKIGSGKRNPDPIEEIARHEVKGDFDSAVRFISRGLKKKAKLYTIYPAGRIETLIRVFSKYGIHPKLILPVYSAPRESARFLLCQGVKNGGEGTKFLKPLYLYRDPVRKIYTEEMINILESITISFK